jgi:conjugal transfer pilin signal peptidase TrbI
MRDLSASSHTQKIAKCYGWLVLHTKVQRFYFRLVAVLSGIALLLYASSYWFTYTLNYTHSLPGTFYVIHKNAALKKGDLIAYRWQGGATYPSGTLFIKKLVGMPGDVVKRVDQSFWINGKHIGIAKEKSKTGAALLPAMDGVIAHQEYFVATSHPDSLDSRYRFLRSNGNVQQQEVIGRAYEIF